uniref:Tetratricopeptide repeat protein n=2 Tax=Desertifilaceae TaxID=1969992 RepID=A0ACD5H0Q5_9CYAN
MVNEQGNLEEAIAYYRKAIQIDPYRASGYYYISYALYDQGKVDEAIDYSRQALKLFDSSRNAPNPALIHNWLGYMLQEQGKITEAIEEYQRAIILEPSLVEAQDNLQYAQQLLNSQKSALPSQ